MALASYLDQLNACHLLSPASVIQQLPLICTDLHALTYVRKSGGSENYDIVCDFLPLARPCPVFARRL